MRSRILILYNNKFSINKISNIIQILKNDINFYYYYIDNKKLDRNIIKLSKFFQTNKFDLVFDLLPNPDPSLKNSKYIKYIKKIFLIRKTIRKFNVMTMKMSTSWIGKYDIFPLKYFIYFRNFFFFIRNFFLEPYYKHNKTNFTIMTGKNCENNEKYFRTKKIYFYHPDFSKGVKSSHKNTLVYIDQFLYSHPDLKVNGVKLFNKRKFTGIIHDVKDDCVLLLMDGHEYSFPIEKIDKANIVPRF